MQAADVPGRSSAVQPLKPGAVAKQGWEAPRPNAPLPTSGARLSRAARAARKKHRASATLVGGRLDLFDIELIGAVCSRSEELGCGYELYTFGVALLTREQRAQLWNGLEPLLDATEYDLAPGESPDPARVATAREVWCEACAQLEIGAQLHDAFVMTTKEWKDAHVEGHAERRLVEAAQKLMESALAAPGRDARADREDAIMWLADRQATVGDAADDIARIIGQLSFHDWPAGSVGLLLKVIAVWSPASDLTWMAKEASESRQLLEALDRDPNFIPGETETKQPEQPEQVAILDDMRTHARAAIRAVNAALDRYYDAAARDTHNVPAHMSDYLTRGRGALVRALAMPEDLEAEFKDALAAVLAPGGAMEGALIGEAMRQHVLEIAWLGDNMSRPPGTFYFDDLTDAGREPDESSPPLEPVVAKPPAPRRSKRARRKAAR
jgi:hypothetical protein